MCRLLISVVGTALCAACSLVTDLDSIAPIDASVPDSGGSDATPSDGSVLDANVPGVPMHPASSLTFHDQDVTQGNATGVVTIGKATDESDVTSYVLYWGTDATTRLGSPITTVMKTGIDLKYSLAGKVPVGANDLLVFTANGIGEMATPVALGSPDNYPHYVDISAGQPGISGRPSIAVDTANDKLLVAMENAGGMGLYRCNSDGTTCKFTDITLGHSGQAATVVIDTTNQKVLVAETVGATGLPGLVRCNLDATGCAFVDISAAQPNSEGYRLRALIDSTNSKLLVVTENDRASAYTPALFRCNLDGTNCTWADLGSGQANTGHYPSPAIDTTNGRLLVAGTTEVGSAYKATLFDCSLDGTSCSPPKDISAGQAQFSGSTPSLVIDTAGSKLLAVLEDDPLFGPGLSRCNLDGTGCGWADVSDGHVSGGGGSTAFDPYALIDSVNGKLLFTTQDTANGSIPALFRCNLDGTGCLYIDISAGQPSDCGQVPQAAIDTKNQRVLVVTDDAANGHKPGLFYLGLF